MNSVDDAEGDRVEKCKSDVLLQMEEFGHVGDVTVVRLMIMTLSDCLGNSKKKLKTNTIHH